MLKTPDSQKIKAIAEKYQVNTVYLFGSQATGKADKNSDYDFAVLLDKKVPVKEYGWKLVYLTEEFMRLMNPNKVDVVIMNEPKITYLLKFNIVKEGKVLYDINKEERVIMEVEAMRNWFDWQYYEEMWRDIFLTQMAEGKIL